MRPWDCNLGKLRRSINYIHVDDDDEYCYAGDAPAGDEYAAIQDMYGDTRCIRRYKICTAIRDMYGDTRCVEYPYAGARAGPTRAGWCCGGCGRALGRRVTRPRRRGAGLHEAGGERATQRQTRTDSDM